ncbi:OsmC family protein [Methylobacter sp. BlB1]|uniref:OsmC family protein n=1 Tax=Methylobacter sp. BlB1 TaxID=2785914 RepID=UPI0018946B60|nr:OsmC family protein [Methylobacter sp. BlB1]MBF6650196.1 OsmC family protein [Methylobacter sp. BlB1]
MELKKVESGYEGAQDLRGFLGISEEVPVGYKNIRVYFKIEADDSENQKEELIRMAQKYSPVFNSLAKLIPISVQLDNQTTFVYCLSCGRCGRNTRSRHPASYRICR